MRNTATGAAIEVETEGSWRTAYGAVIRIRVAVTNEDNWPEQNEGKSLLITLNGPEPPMP